MKENYYKKNLIKILFIMIFSSFALTSCNYQTIKKQAPEKHRKPNIKAYSKETEFDKKIIEHIRKVNDNLKEHPRISFYYIFA